MKKSGLAYAVVFAGFLCACDHPPAPAAPEQPETPAPAVAEVPPAASDSAGPAVPAPPRGKRAPCTNDQSCNRDSSVSALWGHCVKETGVCECNAGFELEPGGHCQPLMK
ncbi:MAG TPA: hypothetical protein VER96_18890 [Polyangiaceae bacterium]|nr:hypothetical protein [Polyangiaceae bacterium]